MTEQDIRKRMDLFIDDYENMLSDQLIRRLIQLRSIIEMKFILRDDDMQEWIDKESDILQSLEKGPGMFKIAEPLIKLCMKEYIEETEHQGPEGFDDWESAKAGIQDFVLFLEHYEIPIPSLKWLTLE